MRWSIWILGCLLLLLVACDEVEPDPTTAPAADQNGDILAVPTYTVRPIVSFTPRFTATPIPSLTFTPSITPTPTDTIVPPTVTPTLTLTPTPTVVGIVQSIEDRVNLRSGPGFNNDVVVSIAVGSEVGVIGYQVDDQGRDWYKIAYEDEDGQEQRLWVRANLIYTDYENVTRVLPSDTPTPADSSTPGPTRTPGATPLPERIDILAYCRQKNVLPPQPTTNDNVYVEWSWYVAREDQMQQHLDNADYEVRLDGRLLEDWEQYATELKLEAGVWIIYWYYPVGQLRAGEHEITYLLTWDEPITDGYGDFGPGTANETNEGNCLFTVTEP